MTAVLARNPRCKPRLPWAPLGAVVACVEVGREPLGRSCKRIGVYLGIDARQVYRWRRDGISPDTADRICFAIGRHPAEFYEDWGGWS